MPTRSRTRTWKQIFEEYGEQFLQWLDDNSLRKNCFNRVANHLESFIISRLIKIEEAQEFVDAIPICLERCDEEIYGRPGVALAYAYLHLLERYHRFWDVLLALVRKCVLPMGDHGLQVLDVGTGPGPSLYAVQDFYAALLRFASESSLDELVTPEPTLEFVESSLNMMDFVHNFSELRRKGPYNPKYRYFDRKNLGPKPITERDRIFMRILSGDTSEYVEDPATSGSGRGMNGLYRFNLVVFSNFLTQENQVKKLRVEMECVFRSLRLGGEVIVVGGMEKQYPRIYSEILDIADRLRINRIDQLPDILSCGRNDYHTHRIKELYVNIWQIAAEKKADAKRCLERLGPKGEELYDPSVGIRGPKAFGIRVFRKDRI